MSGAARTRRRESVPTRAAMLDAAERLMREKGHAAVTTRSVADAAGITRGTVEHHFSTLDDLFITVFRRNAQLQREHLGHALAAPDPVQALWKLDREPIDVRLLTEFMVLARHREKIRGEIASSARRIREWQAGVLAERLPGYGVDTEEMPPLALVLLMTALSRALGGEDDSGAGTAPAETLSAVEELLGRLLPPTLAERLSARSPSAAGADDS